MQQIIDLITLRQGAVKNILLALLVLINTYTMLATISGTGEFAGWGIMQLAGLLFWGCFTFIALVVFVSDFRAWREESPPAKLEDKNTFGIWGGAVRALLASSLTIIFIFTILLFPTNWNEQIPLSLIISLNVALIYYGIKPENILPSSLVHQNDVEKPTNETLLKNFPSVYNFFKGLQDNISTQFEQLKTLVEDIYQEIASQLDAFEEIVNKLNQEMNQTVYTTAKATIGKVKTEVGVKRASYRKQVEMVRTGIDQMKPASHFRNPLEAISFIVVALLVSVIIVTFPNSNQDFVTELVIGSSFTILAITAGSLLQHSISLAPYNSRIQEIYDISFEKLDDIESQVDSQYKKALEQIISVEEELDRTHEELNKYLKSVGDTISEIRGNSTQLKNQAIHELTKYQNQIDEKFNEFRKANFLDHLPQDLSAIITLGIISAVFYLAIIPQIHILNAPKISYAVILWLFSYYFATKK